MKRFQVIEIHEFIDMYPRESVMAMETEACKEYCAHMNREYSGGTTTFKKTMSREEAMQYVIATIQEVLKRPTVTRSNGDLDSVDVEFIEKLMKNFNECYK